MVSVHRFQFLRTIRVLTKANLLSLFFLTRTIIMSISAMFCEKYCTRDRKRDIAIAPNRPLALRGHVTNASLKQWVGILLMPKIVRAHKNYLTPEIALWFAIDKHTYSESSSFDASTDWSRIIMPRYQGTAGFEEQSLNGRKRKRGGERKSARERETHKNGHFCQEKRALS